MKVLGGSRSMGNQTQRFAGLSVRQAAITAAIVYLTGPIGLAEFWIWPKLVVDSDLSQTVQNITDHPQLFIFAILCYLVNFLGDVVMAWALYVLLAPVNKALSLLASWLQVAYAAMALGALFDLLAVHNLLHSPDYLKAFGSAQLHAQVLLMLRGFHNAFNLSLTVFGVHLLLVAYLVFRSNYIPRLISLPLAVAGIGWIINFVGPYMWPTLNFDFATVMAAGELVFMLWLLIKGWSIPQSSIE